MRSECKKAKLTAMSSGANAAITRAPEGFYTAQKRNRRATWRMSAVCMLAAFVMGLPLTLVLTPLMYALTLVTADIINYFSPLPPEFWDNVNSFGRMASQVGDYLFNNRGTLDPQALALTAALVLLPGIVFTFALWLAVLALFRRGGVGGTLAALQAREPNRADLKELQLADVVDEMAIAAGVPSPKIMLVDSPGANAAAVGTSAADARLVISRRLLDDLDRDQLQAVLGHLIASIGNGDLRIAFTVTSVFETCGLLVTLINAPFGKQARRNLWRALRYVLRRGRGDQASSAEAEAVAGLLAGSMDTGSDETSQFFDRPNKSLFAKLITFICFPFFFTNIAIEFTLWVFLSLLLGPCMALLWRTRRYLADAGAVQLTRNPSAMADALRSLSQDSNTVLGGEWTPHLFVTSPKGDHSLGSRQPTPEQMRRALEAWNSAAPSDAQVRADAAPQDLQQMRSQIVALELAAMRGDCAAAARLVTFGRAMSGVRGLDPDAANRIASGDHKKGTSGLQAQSMMSFHPSLKRRLRKLERMGAHYTPEAHTQMSKGSVIVMGVLYLILGPLLLTAGALMLVVVAMMVMLNLVFLGMWIAVIHAIFTALGHR